jgi:HAD superfamily hydrolase (TIGR01459 family)
MLKTVFLSSGPILLPRPSFGPSPSSTLRPLSSNSNMSTRADIVRQCSHPVPASTRVKATSDPKHLTSFADLLDLLGATTTGHRPPADATETTIASSTTPTTTARYHALLLDQFGVLHDGQVPYPGAIDMVRAVHATGCRILLLSNSSRRSSGALRKLSAMGFPEAAFHGVITSGELTFRSLRDRPTPAWSTLGNRPLWLTWGDRGAISLADLDLHPTAEPEDCTFILAHGTEAIGGPHPDGTEFTPTPFAGLVSLLHRAAARVPAPTLVLANPDLVTVDGGTGLRPMPGMLAREYRNRGGNVFVMGKPDPRMYAAAMKELGLRPEECLAVGDSLEHDIAGANAAGCDSVFITGGIHAEECEIVMTEEEGMGGLFEAFEAIPTYVCNRFSAKSSE